MTPLKQDQLGLRAAIGIVAGMALAIAAGVVNYFTFTPGHWSIWFMLVLPAFPLIAWGSSHLARHRGYPGAAGYGLFMLGFLAFSLVAITNTPVTVGFAFVFIALLPPVVLFALPKKPGGFRR